MVQKVPFTHATGNTMTLGTGTSRVIMGADSGNLKIQDSQSNTSVIEAGLGVQGAGGTIVVANNAQLPTSGANLAAGKIAWSTANSSLFISNGSGWYRITIVNQTPTVTVSPSSFQAGTGNLTADFTYTVSDDVGTPTVTVANSGIASSSEVNITHTSSNNHIRAVFDGSTDLTGTITITASDGFSQGTATATLTVAYTAKEKSHTRRLIRALGADGSQITANPTNAITSGGASLSSGGTVYQSSFSPFRNRNKGYSWYFDSNSNAAITFDGSGTIMSGKSSFTAEVWYYHITGNSGWDTIWSSGSSGYNQIGRLYQNSSSLYLYWSGSSNISVTNVFNDPGWKHIALTWDGTTTKIYVNGEQVTSSSSPAYGGSDDIVLGQASYYPHAYFHDFRVVKNAVVYTGEFNPPTDSLSLYTTGGAVTPILAARKGFYSNEGTAATVVGDITLANADANPESRIVPATPYDGQSYNESFDGKGSYWWDGGGSNIQTFTLPAAIGTGTFTGEVWAWLDTRLTANYYYRLMNFNQNPNVYYRGSAYTGRDNEFAVYTPDQYPGNEDTSIEAFRWHHVVIQRDASNNLDLYVNGKREHRKTSHTTNMTSTTVQLGGGSPTWKGFLCDFRVVVGTAVYSGNFNPPTGPLTATGGTYGDGTNNVDTSITSGHTKILLSSITPAFGDISQSENGLVAYNDISTQTEQIKYGGRSLYFDGTSDRIEFQMQPVDSYRFELDRNYFKGYDDGCIEAWVYVNADASFNIYNQGGGSNGSIALYWVGTGTNAGKFGINVYGGGAGLTTNTYAKQNWYHVAAVRKGKYTKLYINGVEDSGARYDGSDSNVTNVDLINIGKTWNSVETNNGYMQDFRITKEISRYPWTPELVALTTTNSTRSGATVSSASNTKLLCCNSTTDITAKSGANASNITITNSGALQSTFGPVSGVGSSLFRGSDYIELTDTTGTKAWEFGTGAFTIEFYIYHRSTVGSSTYNPYIAMTGTDGIYIARNSGNLIVRRSGNTNDISASHHDDLFKTRRWHHVAVCRNGSNLMQAFIDGFLVGEDTSASHSYAGGTLRIGADSGNSYSTADAYISSVRIIQGQALYSNSFTPPSGLLVG